MAPLRTALALALLVSTAHAYSGASSFAFRPLGSAVATASARSAGRGNLRMENFGLDFAEDASKNTPKEIFGEVAIKESYVPRLKKDALLTSDYPLLDRVAEKGLLSKTAEAGILTTLTEKGLTLSQLESLLPVLEELGLLSAAVENKNIFLNLIAPVLVEPAPLLLGPLAAALSVDSVVYLAAAAGCAGLEAYGVVQDGSLSPLPILGIVLFGGLGAVLSSLTGDGPSPVVASTSAAPASAPSSAMSIFDRRPRA